MTRQPASGRLTFAWTGTQKPAVSLDLRRQIEAALDRRGFGADRRLGGGFRQPPRQAGFRIPN